MTSGERREGQVTIGVVGMSHGSKQSRLAGRRRPRGVARFPQDNLLILNGKISSLDFLTFPHCPNCREYAQAMIDSDPTDARGDGCGRFTVPISDGGAGPAARLWKQSSLPGQTARLEIAGEHPLPPIEIASAKATKCNGINKAVQKMSGIGTVPKPFERTGIVDISHIG